MSALITLGQELKLATIAFPTLPDKDGMGYAMTTSADRRRQEVRFGVNLEVRLWGLDSEGRPFNTKAETVDITPKGARLRGFHCSLKKGDVVGMQYMHAKGRFRVAWVGQPETPKYGQLGLQSVDPGRTLWDVQEFVRNGAKPVADEWLKVSLGQNLQIEPLAASSDVMPGGRPAAPISGPTLVNHKPHPAQLQEPSAPPLQERLANAAREVQVCRIVAETQRLDQELCDDLRTTADATQQLVSILQRYTDAHRLGASTADSIAQLHNERVRRLFGMMRILDHCLANQHLELDSMQTTELQHWLQTLAKRLQP
jgi:hypothetical protein